MLITVMNFQDRDVFHHIDKFYHSDSVSSHWSISLKVINLILITVINVHNNDEYLSERWIFIIVIDSHYSNEFYPGYEFSSQW